MNVEKKDEHQHSSYQLELECYRTVLGERLKQVRFEYAGGESLEKFGKRFHRSKTTVARYEDGSRDADAWFIHQISQEFGLAQPWILSGVGSPAPENGEITPSEGSRDGKNSSPLMNIGYQDVLDDIALVVREVEEIIVEKGVSLTPSGKGKLMALVFDYLVTRSEEVNEPVSAQIIRLMRFGT